VLPTPASLQFPRLFVLALLLSLSAACDSSTSDGAGDEVDGGGQGQAGSGPTEPPPTVQQDAGNPVPPVTQDSGTPTQPVIDAGSDEEDDAGDDDEPSDEDDPIDEDPEETYGAIVEVADHQYTEANDLRGLTFAANGKIYASGHTDVIADNRQLVIARFNEDGTPDTDFDGDGFKIVDVVPGDEQSFGIVELANEDIIVQVSASDGQGGAMIADTAAVPGPDVPRPHGQDIKLLRFTSTGAPVTTFGTNGVRHLDFGRAPADDGAWPVPTYNSSLPANQRFSGTGFPVDNSWAIALDDTTATEKIVVFGFGPAKKVAAGTQRYDNDRYILRVLASDGAPDTSFNVDGSPFTVDTLAGLGDNARRGFVEPDGSIVSAGYANFGAGFGNHVVAIRLLPDGTPDPEFGFGIALPGATRFNPFVDNGGAAECYAIVKQSSGRYVTTGYGAVTATGLSSSYEGYASTTAADLVSFAFQDGALDGSYGNAATVAFQSEELTLGGTEDRGRHLLVLPDDRLVHVGRFGVNATIFVTLPDGQLDQEQGVGGMFDYPPAAVAGVTAHFFGAALSPDGTRIAATTTSDANGVVLAILEVEEED
jgi:uncharacterized delta-60 repeat protein